MSRICELTGRRFMVGNNVSHSKTKTKRRFYPNLHVKRFYVPELDKTVKIKVSTKALRTIDKKGIYIYLKELEKKGIKIL